jgi:hypothetical protein
MSEYNDEYYYQKYLKYKNKYLELKQYEGGANFMPTFKTGVYVYFCTKQDADNICKEVDKKTTNIMSIHNILTKDPTKLAFYAKQGATKITQVEKYRTASVGEGIASGTSSAFSAMAKGVRTVGSAMAKGAKDNIGKPISDRINKTLTSNIKTDTFKDDDDMSGGGKIIKIDLTDKNNMPKKLDISDTEYLKSLIMKIRKKYNENINTIIKITYSPMGSNICNYKKTWTDNELNPKKEQVGQEQVGQEQVGQEQVGQEEQVEKLSTDLVPRNKVLPEQLSDTPTQSITLSKRVGDRGRALAASARARVAEAAEAKAAAAKAPRLLLEQSPPKARPPMAMTRAKTTSELLRRSTSDQI